MPKFEFRPMGAYERVGEHKDLFVRFHAAGGLTTAEAARYADQARQGQLAEHTTHRIGAFAGDALVGAFVSYEDRVNLRGQPNLSVAMQRVMGRTLNGDYTDGVATFAHITELVTEPELRPEVEPDLTINGLRAARELYDTQLMKFRLSQGASEALFDGEHEAFGFAQVEAGIPGHGADPSIATRNEYIGLIGDGIALMQQRQIH